MRLIVGLCILISVSSCVNAGNDKIEKLREQVTSIEKRLDSLRNPGTTQRYGIYNTDNVNDPGSGSPHLMDKANRCQAITRKGTQCKRTANYGSYCWQHD